MPNVLFQNRDSPAFSNLELKIVKVAKVAVKSRTSDRPALNALGTRPYYE